MFFRTKAATNVPPHRGAEPEWREGNETLINMDDVVRIAQINIEPPVCIVYFRKGPDDEGVAIWESMDAIHNTLNEIGHAR